MQENTNLHQRKTSIISIINQKGGVGKSTVTTLLANIFYFIFNKEVAIIDADYPQQTIYKRHLETAKEISKKPLIREATELFYKDRNPICIFPTEISNVPKVMDDIDGQFDLVFLDIAGTLNQVGIDKVLSRVNHFFIPVLQDSDTYKSSVEFYKVLAEAILPHSTAFESCHFFLNNLPHKNQGKLYRKLLAEQTAGLLENDLSNYVIYERAFRSTLLPIPTLEESKMYQKEISKLHRFAKEVLTVLGIEFKTVANPILEKKEELGLHQTDTTKANTIAA